MSTGSEEKIAAVSEKAVSPTRHALDRHNRDDLEIIDETALASCGYKQEFKRELNLFSCFSVSFSVVGILPSVATTLFYAIGLAGRAGMTWGFLVGYTGIHAVALGMAEIASSMPTSGGNYYAVACLAPPKIAPFLTWFCGWSNYIGLVLGCPSVNYGNASMISALLLFRDPSYEDTFAKRFGIAVSLTALCAVCAALPTKWMGRLNSTGTWIQVAALLITIIGVPIAALNRPRFVSNHEAWGTITNGTDYPDGIAILFAWLTAIWTMSGYDAGFHMSEECSNAQIAVPRTIALTSTIGAISGWGLLIVVAYTAVDTVAVASSAQPWIGWLFQVTPPPVATAFSALAIITGFLCSQGCAISASRLCFAYGRDGVLPFSRYLSRMNTKTYTPVNAVCWNLLVQTCVLCLIFGGPITIGAVFSITAVGMYVTFITPIFLKLFFAGDRWRPGPWTLGRWSKPIGIYACAWVALMVPILNMPFYRGADVTPTTMNWTCLVWGGPMLLACIWYALIARKTFKGPKINIEHLPNSDIDIDPAHTKLAEVRAIVQSVTRDSSA